MESVRISEERKQNGEDDFDRTINHGGMKNVMFQFLYIYYFF